MTDQSTDDTEKCRNCGGTGYEKVHAGVIECDQCGGTGRDNTDQYDTLLRAMEDGLIIGINNSDVNETPLGEGRVRWSYDGRTEVMVSGHDGNEYQIHYDRRGELVYSEVTEDGLSYEDKVVTLEVFGLDE